MDLEDAEEEEFQTGAVMTDHAQQVRRNSIRHILADDSLTPIEKRKSIQSLMDGRRRSSTGTRSSSGSVGEMARAAAEAAEYYTSDTEGDEPMRDEQNDPQHVHHYREPNSQGSSSSGNSSGDTNDQAPTGAEGQVDFMDNLSTHQQQRRQRSSSMPLWSANSVNAVAPLAAASSNIWDDPINLNRRMEKSRPPCAHYERNCTIISPCCGLAFGCRICHDECPVLPMPFSKRQLLQQAESGNALNNAQVAWSENSGGVKTKVEKRRSLPLGFDEEETHHEIDRFAIAECICRLCYVRQSSKTKFCATCQAQFGAYHCDICNLWMSDDESPYHCSDCGFCRVGGRENFRHCDDCGMCIDTLLFDDHNCKAGKYMSNCPVCQEDLFSSRDASHEMPCGHAIHWHCFKELTSYDTRCPVCKKTAETPEHMAPTWQAMAMGIALQPVPPELARVVTIMCNDCEQRDVDRRWHFLGVRCLGCMSFNTTIERTTMTGREAAGFLDDLDAAQGSDETANGDVHMDAEGHH